MTISSRFGIDFYLSEDEIYLDSATAGKVPIKSIKLVEEFYKDQLHGREHALDVTKTTLKWVQQFEFDQIDGFDLEVLVVAGFLHDIKGLGASGSEKRKNHHWEGALCANIILKKMGWEESRIKKVKHCI